MACHSSIESKNCFPISNTLILSKFGTVSSRAGYYLRVVKPAVSPLEKIKRNFNKKYFFEEVSMAEQKVFFSSSKSYTRVHIIESSSTYSSKNNDFGRESLKMTEIRQKYRNFGYLRKSRQRLLSLAFSSESWICPSMGVTQRV